MKQNIFSAKLKNMHARFPFKPLLKYPHLFAKEVEIWDRFVKANPLWAEEADYDVVCGEATKVPSDSPQYHKDNANYLSKWKIDVVAIKGNLRYIIEVRPYAGLGAIGEIISKATMFQEEHPDLPEVEPVIITDLERPDMRRLCADRNIGYIVL